MVPERTGGTLVSGAEGCLDRRRNTAPVGDLVPVGPGPLPNRLRLLPIKAGAGNRYRL